MSPFSTKNVRYLEMFIRERIIVNATNTVKFKFFQIIFIVIIGKLKKISLQNDKTSVLR